MKVRAYILAASLAVGSCGAWAAGDLPTKFSNIGTVGNTRHNMTQHQTVGGPNSLKMDDYRNDYAQVCVYCHTPHGANTDASATGAPLWNRTMKATAYTNYSSGTLQGTVNAPGIYSRMCLSCHDGTTAIDSIINMPGSGNYNVAQQTVQNDAFLNTWNNPSGSNPSVHADLAVGSCLGCHSPTGGIPGAGASDFTAGTIGTDLSNDHPIAIDYPASGDFVNVGTMAIKGSVSFFDNGNGTHAGNGHPDPDEIQLFGGRVECSTCHDPHGVPSVGAGSAFTPVFLRKTNTNSALCLSCHVK